MQPVTRILDDAEALVTVLWLIDLLAGSRIAPVVMVSHAEVMRDRPQRVRAGASHQQQRDEKRQRAASP